MCMAKLDSIHRPARSCLQGSTRKKREAEEKEKEEDHQLPEFCMFSLGLRRAAGGRSNAQSADGAAESSFPGIAFLDRLFARGSGAVDAHSRWGGNAPDYSL